MGSRRARSLRPFVVLATLLGLAACTAGVPQTGSVVVVSPVTSAPPPVDPEAFQDVSGGPFSGQSDAEVAVGFMNAMNTGDVSKIQRWLMPRAQDEVAAWAKPTATVRVYSVFEPGPEQVIGERRIVPIKVKLVGQLRDGRDWYPSTGDDVLSLELQRSGGEARVANPGSAIWVRDVNFSKLFAPAEIYMAPDLTDLSPKLAPVPVFVPNATEGQEETAAQVRVKGALKLLLAGPQGRYGNLSTAIPPGTTLGFRYAKDVVTLNLNHRFMGRGGPGQLRIGQLRVGQLVWTVNRLLPTASVRILVDGRRVRSVGIDKFPVERRWNRQDEPLMSMWPQRSPVRSDDTIVFVRHGEVYEIAPKTGQSPRPVEVIAPSPKSAPTWSPDRRALAFLVGSGSAQSLWLVPPEGADGKAELVTEGLPGKLSPPTWSPDSDKVYTVLRDAAGARLLEVTRRTLSRRFLPLPPLPSGLRPASITISPDGAFVLAIADRPDRKVEEAEPVPGGQLYLGQFGPDGVTAWSERPIAPGLGRIFSPVWVDPVTVGFIAETGNKDDLGKLWTIKSDGWNPTALLNDTDIPIGDIGNNLAVDPTGTSFVVTARSNNGASLWMINRQEKTPTYLTLPVPNAFDTDPSFASR